MGNVIEFPNKKRNTQVDNTDPSTVNYISYTMTITSAHDKHNYYGCDASVSLDEINGSKEFEMSAEQFYRMLILDAQHMLDCLLAEEGDE